MLLRVTQTYIRYLMLPVQCIVHIFIEETILQQSIEIYMVSNLNDVQKSAKNHKWGKT